MKAYRAYLEHVRRTVANGRRFSILVDVIRTGRMIPR